MFYAGPFAISTITTTGATLLNVTDLFSGQVFWLGNDTIVGPITTEGVIPKGTDYYVKVTDVSPATPSIPSSDVAVSVNQWRPYETLAITPTWGPAGTEITATGMAFIEGEKVNITWIIATDVVVPLIDVPEAGTFTATFFAPDEEITDGSTMDVTVWAIYNDTATIADSVTFTEYGRVWLQIDTSYGPAGNDWYGGDVAVLDEIWVAGNYFNPRGTLSLYWDYGATGQVTLAANKI
jgi:hypothetical protein